MMMRGLLLTCLLLGLAVDVSAATLRARLIRASQNDGGSDARLEDLRPKLAKVFGFSHYHQLGDKRAPLRPDRLERINLGKGFVVFARDRGAQPGGRTAVELEWYSGKVAISKQSLMLRPGQLIFIKGPEVGSDWILLSVSMVP